MEYPIALRKKPWSCTLHHISKFVSYSTLSETCRAFTSNLDMIRIPKDGHEALEVHKWNKGVMEEMKALKKNGTWDVVELPEGKRTVGYKLYSS